MAKKIKVGLKVPTLNEMNKRYGTSLALKASEVVDHNLWIPSSFHALNYLMGGGCPWGKIIEVAGQESSGKSLIAYDFAVMTQKLGGYVIWVDAEQAWSNHWAEANGIDLSRVAIITNTQVETISDALADLSIFYRSQLQANEPILIVVDSIAAMDCIDSINSKMADGKAEMGSRAKAIYKMFRIRNELFYKLGITQIYINQVRTSLNTGFGADPTTTPGGKALAFYASIRLQFFGGRVLTIKNKGKDRKSGRYVTIRVMKNKVAPPRATISKAPMYFEPRFHRVGFDQYFGLEDVFYQEDIIEKTSGGVYKLDGETLARGEEKFKQLLEENSKVRNMLLTRSGINTLKATKANLKAQEYNLFPISEDIDYESQKELDDEEDSEDIS